MGRCMFFTVLLCLVLSLSEATTPATTGSSSTITTVLATDGNTSTTTENTTATNSSSATPESSSVTTVETSTTSETPPTATIPATTGSSSTITAVLATDESSSATTVETSTTSETPPTDTPPATTGSNSTITTVLATDGNTSTTTENTTAANSSSATPESSSATTVETSTTSETPPTDTPPATTGSNSTITTVLATDGNTSTTTENTTAANSSSATPESSSATTVETSTTSETPPTDTPPATTGSNSTITTVLATDGNVSTTTENTTAANSSSATPESSSTTTVETSTTSETPPTDTPPATTGSNSTITTVLATDGNVSTTTENTTAANSSSATPGHTSTTTWETSTTSATPTLEELCKPSLCGSILSTCVPLNTTHICQCPYGFYYYNKNCYAGKVFPVIITLAQTLSSDIGDANSMEYEKMVQNITEFFEKAFKNMTDYRQTIIVKVNYTADDTSTRSGNNPVTVTVMNIFTANTTATDADVEKAIETEAGNSNYVSGYTNATQCAVYPCDDATTTCQVDSYPICVCKADFAKTQWDTYSCSDCVNCTAEENKFCDRQSDTPECKCLNNFKKEGEKCVRCPVGYSGENCENDKELILIIVGTVFGAIILCLVAAVSIVSVRAKHSHDPEKKRLIKPRNSNSNTSEETRIFPRVQTTSGHANPGYQPNNPYEVHSSNRGDFVEKDYDDLYEISRQPEGFRLQRR